MKNFLLIAIFIFSSESFASCFEFELIGEGLIEDDHLKFVIAKSTQSEVKLPIPIKDQDLFSPYIHRWGKALLILDRPGLSFSTKVLKVISVEYQTPDPLNMSSSTNVKKIRKVPCPKN